MNSATLNFTVRAANMTELATLAYERAASFTGEGWELARSNAVYPTYPAVQVYKEDVTYQDPNRFEVEGEFTAHYVRIGSSV